MAPKIIFEDESLLIVDKPAGITVNKSDTTSGEITVQDWAEEKIKIPVSQRGEQNSDITINEESDFFKRGGIVHRLDKETSGILILAKTEDAFYKLQAQFKERNVKKTYLALAHGEVKPVDGEIQVPVGRLPWNRKQFGVVAGGREAMTRYHVISSFKSEVSKEQLTLVELYPETGRTHQIRVHLKHIGYPIFGDFLYAGRKVARADRKLLPRVFLHAAKISFTHPVNGEKVSYESELPEELSVFLKTLQKVELNP